MKFVVGAERYLTDDFLTARFRRRRSRIRSDRRRARGGTDQTGTPLARRAGLVLRQAYEREGKRLRRRAGGYAHAKQQFRRLRRVLKRQRTVLGHVLRDIERKRSGLPLEQQASLTVWLERAWRICRQRPKDKMGLKVFYALAALFVLDNSLAQSHAHLAPALPYGPSTGVKYPFAGRIEFCRADSRLDSRTCKIQFSSKVLNDVAV
ncbi:Mobile element protein [Candidatus Burkholderia brachyanthoides]|nr:Mobile element protein [Candidatus Burkholderia brachyanthoides]